MNWTALKTEIALPAYAGMTDVQIADAINTKTVTNTQHFYVSARTLYAVLGPTKGKSVMSAISDDDPVLYQIMLQVGDTSGLAGGIDVSLADSQSYIATLVARNIITQADADALITLSQVSTSWRAEALAQFDPVSADQIEFARSLGGA